MANTSISLSRTAYTEVADAADTVTVTLPNPPQRSQNRDTVELISATSSPTVPTEGAHRDAVILDNFRFGFLALTNYTVPTGEKLYARWLSEHPYDDEAGNDSDLYVVTF